MVVPGSDDADPACGPYATKSIERFQEGDRVLAWDAAAGRLVFDRVTRSLNGACDHLRLVTFEDAQGRRQTLRTTDRHPFWFPATGEWICAGDLRPGMLCQGPNGEPLTVTATTREDHPTGVAVYNLTVEPSHNYFVQETPNPATPVLVHNAKKKGKGVGECGPDDDADKKGGNTSSTGGKTASNLGPSPSSEIARHAIERGHWPGRTLKQVQAMIDQIRATFQRKYVAPSGETIYLKGDTVVIENPVRGEGTIFKPDRDALEYYKEWVRNHPGGM